MSAPRNAKTLLVLMAGAMIALNGCKLVEPLKPSARSGDPVIARADIVYSNAAINGYSPFIVHARNGDLIVCAGTRGDAMPVEKPQDVDMNFVRSSDLGKTWKLYMTSKSGDPLTGLAEQLFTLPGGRVLRYALEPVWSRMPDMSKPDYLVVCGGTKFNSYYSISEDNGFTFSARKPLTDPASNPVKRMDFAQGNIVALTNGDLLWSWGDRGNPPLNGFKRSTDGGLTWGAMVRAFQDPPPGFVKPLSFNETGVAVCKDGSIVAVARVDGAPGNDKRFWQIKSSDNGKTWSTPRPIEIQGGSPALYCTPKGQLWLAYRDAGFGPGLGLAVSDDKGEHWRFLYHLKDPQGDGYEKRFGHVRYTDEDRRQPWRPGEGMVGYPTFAKLSDNEVYVVFYTQNMRGTVCIPGTCIAGNLLRIPE